MPPLYEYIGMKRLEKAPKSIIYPRQGVFLFPAHTQ